MGKRGSTRAGSNNPRHRRRGLVIAAWVAGGLLVLLGIAYLAAHLLASDSAPRHASVNGVAIGGLSPEDAVAKLTAELGPADSAQLTLTGEPDQSAAIEPAAAGMAVDYTQTVRRSGAGASWDPRDLVKVLTGGGETAPVVHVDRDQLATAVEALAPAFTRAAVDAGVTLEGGQIVRTPMVKGTELVQPDTADAIERAWRDAVHRPVTDPRDAITVAATLVTDDPAVTDAAADEFAVRLDAQLQPVKIKTPSAEAELTREQIAQVTTIDATDGQLTANQDVPKLYHEVAGDTVDTLSIAEPRDATVQIQGGVPVVVPSVDGQSITEEDFIAGVTGALTAPAPREVSLEVKHVPAKFTTEDAQALGIKEVIGEFTTYYGNTAYHNTNLGNAAAGINNELVKPGETFSLGRATGLRNSSTGYIAGGVLVGDHIEMIVGGGVSQSATTTYNAAFFAGMTDIEHHPHTQYFSQYPMGREATVFQTASGENILDLRFRNDTPYGVLMQAFITPSTASSRGSITVRVWSTKYFDSVIATDPVTSNFRDGTEKVSDRPGCIPQSPSRGFDVSFQRHLTLNGQTTVEDYFHRYSPIDRITCQA